MKISHNFYSKLAFQLAEQNLGKTGVNPSVGCVVVKNNSVISSAVTSLNGRPHAEFNALNRNLNFKDTQMYITLEPCTHYGLTPPCTSIIKNKKVKKIYYSFHDVDERTYKKAKKILKKKIKHNKVESEYKDFYNSYYYNKKKKLPFVDAKLAISKDFFTINKKNKWVTKAISRRIGHLIRSKYDCIISTSETINKDNSLLNCRIEGLDNNKPDLLIIDRNLQLKKKLKLFDIFKKRKIYLLTTSNNKMKISFLKKKNIKIIKFNKLEDGNDFINLFKKMYSIGKRRLLVESGLVFLNKLFKFKLVNNLFLFKSDVLLKNNGFNNCKINFIKNLKFKKKINVNLKGDQLLKIRVN